MRKLIDFTINEKGLEKAVQNVKGRNIVIPTFAQMKDPDKIPAKVKEN